MLSLFNTRILHCFCFILQQEKWMLAVEVVCINKFVFLLFVHYL